MTNLKEKLKNTLNWIKENPKKTLLGAGLTALVATTSLKENVHFGSITLNNPQENHYVLGIFPTTEIQGENSKGDIYTFGLIVGENYLGDNSKITGDMSAYGLGVGENIFVNNSQITGNMNAYSLVVGINHLGKNYQITGDISTKGILAYNSVTGDSFGSNDVNGLKNYVHKIGENKKHL